jgi:hypothetical protein
MAYFIFLKYLRSIEEFRKNPHVKIPHKSPPTNFQSLGIFKNQIFIWKGIFPSLSAHPVFRPSRGPFSFSFFSTPPPLSPLGLGLSAGPAHPNSPTGCLLPRPAPEPSTQTAATGRPRATPRALAAALPS